MAEPVIYRYEVPVDDRWHTLELTGQIRHVASRSPEMVEFWATANTERSRRRRFRVFGTGQPLPAGLEASDSEGPNGIHLGTAITAGGSLVWHLYEWVAEVADGD